MEKKLLIFFFKRRFHRWAYCIFYLIFFGLVMCYESQTWSLMIVEKSYIIYFVYNDFIQSFLSTHWIKLNFNSKWILNFEILSCTFYFIFPLYLRFPKNVIKILPYCIHIILVIHHFFEWKLLKNGSPIVCFHLNVSCKKKSLFIYFRDHLR